MSDHVSLMLPYLDKMRVSTPPPRDLNLTSIPTTAGSRTISTAQASRDARERAGGGRQASDPYASL